MPLTTQPRSRRAARYRPLYQLDKRAGVLAQDGPAVARLPAPDDASMTIAAVISTPVRDRIGDVMEPLGCLVENYRRNAVVLLGHGLGRFPIASSLINGQLCVWPEATRVWAKARFHDHTQDSTDAYALWRDGILNSTSIGFKPLQAEPMKSQRGGELAGLHIKVWDLLEWSLVDVPMNFEAVRLGWQGDRLASILGRGWIEAKRPITDLMRKAL